MFTRKLIRGIVALQLVGTLAFSLYTPVIPTVNAAQASSITIEKNAISDNNQVFHFSTTGLSTDTTGFDLVDDSTPGLPSRVFSNLSAGTYTVSEDATLGWDFDNLSCTRGASVDKNGASVTIDLAVGEDVTCTYTNRQKPIKPKGDLTILKFFCATAPINITPQINTLNQSLAIFNCDSQSVPTTAVNFDIFKGPNNPVLPIATATIMANAIVDGAGATIVHDLELSDYYTICEKSINDNTSWVKQANLINLVATPSSDYRQDNCVTVFLESDDEVEFVNVPNQSTTPSPTPIITPTPTPNSTPGQVLGENTTSRPSVLAVVTELPNTRAGAAGLSLLGALFAGAIMTRRRI